MFPETQAEVFIKTLADMLTDERERRSIRLQSQHRAYAERVLQIFRKVPALAQGPRVRQAELESVGLRWGD